MKMIYTAVILIFTYLQVYSQCADTANIYTFQYDDKSYEIVKEMKEWDEAAACSKERGGYLVEINSSPEQDQVFDAILNGAGVSPTYVEVQNGGGIAYVWIGATDSELEGTWLWDGDADGEGIHFWTGEGANGDNNGVVENDAYVNWGGTKSGGAKEPDNYGGPGQDQAAIGLTGWPAGTILLGEPGEWNDIIGTSAIYYVIEYDTILGSPTRTPLIPEEQISIFPNPTKGVFQVQVSGFTTLELSDLTGRLVGTFYRPEIDITSVRSGIYFYTLYTSSGKYTGKILRE